MIGIDTNVLLRRGLHDDPARNNRVDALPAEHGGTPGSLPVTDVILAKAVWTPKSVFDQDPPAQLPAARSILDEVAFAIEDRAAVVPALHLFEAGDCGFADCLAFAKRAWHGCAFTATFDRGMRKPPGVTVRRPAAEDFIESRQIPAGANVRRLGWRPCAFGYRDKGHQSQAGVPLTSPRLDDATTPGLRPTPATRRH